MMKNSDEKPIVVPNINLTTDCSKQITLPLVINGPEVGYKSYQTQQ